MATRKTIFITGGASGIGKATALHFAARGWFVGLADIDEAGLEATRRQIGERDCSTHKLDVRDLSAWQAALTDFWAVAGERLDVLFNNAGIARGGAFADVAPEDHDLLIDVNFKGVVHGAEAGLPWLRRTQGSCLINTCSAAGIYGAPGLATYAATKFAVRGLSEALEAEWTPLGIKVRTIMPSFIDTPLLDITTSGTNRSAREGVRDAGLEFTPVEQVAQSVWDSINGDALHMPVGKTAKGLAFMARWAPGMLRKRIMRAPASRI
jgi:NAD(P)-dependent dehydrogenase (short-subunit alcohol dehydrogenase family)